MKKRWKRAGKARPDDYNVVRGTVPWPTQWVRFLTFWKKLPKEKKNG